MGHVFRPLTTWSKYILTSDLAFEEYYGAKATKNGSFTTEPYEQIYSNTGEHVHQENHGKTKKAGVKNEGSCIFTRSERNSITKKCLDIIRLGFINWDARKSSPFRGEVEGYLTGLYFERSIGPVIQEALAYFETRPEELSELGKLVLKK